MRVTKHMVMSTQVLMALLLCLMVLDLAAGILRATTTTTKSTTTNSDVTSKRFQATSPQSKSCHNITTGTSDPTKGKSVMISFALNKTAFVNTTLSNDGFNSSSPLVDVGIFNSTSSSVMNSSVTTWTAQNEASHISGTDSTNSSIETTAPIAATESLSFSKSSNLTFSHETALVVCVVCIAVIGLLVYIVFRFGLIKALSSRVTVAVASVRTHFKDRFQQMTIFSAKTSVDTSTGNALFSKNSTAVKVVDLTPEQHIQQEYNATNHTIAISHGVGNDSDADDGFASVADSDFTCGTGDSTYVTGVKSTRVTL
jgi:hypothetical protein